MVHDIPDFYKLSADQANRVIVFKDYHTHDYKTGDLLDKPAFEIAGHGKEWPPCIGPQKSRGPLLFRSDVVESIKDANLIGVEFQLVEFIKIGPKNLKTLPAPNYYSTKAIGVIKTRAEFYEIMSDNTRKFKIRAEEVGDSEFSSYNKGKHDIKVIPLKESWDKSDFFSNGSRMMYGAMFCSRAFVELAHLKKWKGFCIQPLDSFAKYYGDFLDLPWPPSEWYPEYQI